MTPASAKAKGRLFQQFCRDKIIDKFKPYGVEPGDVKSTSMGAGGEDIQLSPFARTLFGFSIECKFHKSMAIYKLYEQAEENAEGHVPLLFVKANNKKPLAVVDVDTFMEMAEALHLKETSE